MASHGIKDQVAIVGMGCTPFREHWDKGLDDLLIDATTETFASAGLAADDVDAFWLGTAQSGMSGITLAAPLKLHDKPVTRVENFCASGSESLRQAAYAVASGAYDVAMAVGRREGQGQRVPGAQRLSRAGRRHGRSLTAAAMFSLVLPAYARRYGVDEDELKRVLARIAWKNHHNGARNPRAQFRKEMDLEVIANAPAVAGRLGIFDCAGVADGAAAAIVVRASEAHRYTDKPLYIKALSFVAGNGSGSSTPTTTTPPSPRWRRPRPTPTPKPG